METLKTLLTTKVGSHFLDSGKAYGYRHEKNAKIDFDNQPMVELDDYGITVNVYPYLESILEEDETSEEINKQIEQYNREREENGEDTVHWVGEVCEEVIQNLPHLGYDFKILGRGEETVVNTYNHDSFLSQTLLYSIFESEENEEFYIALQIHQGCDVRGGYTMTRVFKINELLDSCPYIYGVVNGVQVDTGYDGYNLTTEEGEKIDLENIENYGLEVMEGETIEYLF